MKAVTPTWNEAFTSRDPIAAQRLLGEIKERFATTPHSLDKAFLLLGESTAYALLGQLDAARRSLRKAIKLGSEDNVLFQLHAEFIDACLFEKEGQFKNSLDRFNQILKNYQSELKNLDNRYLYQEIQYRRGTALACLEDYDKALPILEEALQFDLSNEDRSNLYCHIALGRHKLRDDAVALDYFLRARDIGVGQNWKASFHYHLGYTYYRLREFSRAKGEFIVAEQEYKGSGPKQALSQVYQMLAYTSKALGQRADAELYSRMAKPD